MRELGNWIEGYMEFTFRTESAPVFHKWVACSIIAAVLRKKVNLELGRLNIYPNLYIVLVAEPGIARKTQAITFGTKFLGGIPDIHTSADSITREALLNDLEACAIEDTLPNGESFRHSSISIISKEFESFLGQRIENTKMLVLLTDLFDCSEDPWKYNTKNAGKNVIPSVYVNLLGATTPDSLANCLPPTAIGGGLTSRILFVWASEAGRKETIPELTPRVLELKELLQQDLYKISKIVGTYQFSTDCRQYWIDWYNRYDSNSPERICLDKSFDGWYSRKPLFILKMCMILSAARHSSLIIDIGTMEQAISFIEEVESHMGKTFRAVGRSSITADVDMVMSIIQSRGVISESDLMNLIWRDIDSTKFDNVIGTAKKTGAVERIYSYDGVKGIFYISKDAKVLLDAKAQQLHSRSVPRQ